jgi:hypothetical protein
MWPLFHFFLPINHSQSSIGQDRQGICRGAVWGRGTHSDHMQVASMSRAMATTMQGS